MIFLSSRAYSGFELSAIVPFLAGLFMSDSDNNDDSNAGSNASPSMGKDWGSGFGSGRQKLFEKPEDFDIYCDRERGINYIFHGPELNCTIDHLEYNPDTQRINVITNDSQTFDLGAKVQWLVRPYIAQEQFLYIIRTENGKAIDGVEVHLKIKVPEIQKTLN